MVEQRATAKILEKARAANLIGEQEMRTVLGVFDPEFAFAEALYDAETIHVHVKVDDANLVDQEQLCRWGGKLDYAKDGFVKFTFDGGVNLIFSSIDVSEDDLVETPCARRVRPFVDHIGIDMRREADEVRSTFDALPAQAEKNGMSHVAQGGPNRPVYCCHVEVGRKHWIYPSGTPCAPGIPLEFAFGALKMNAESSGCDLRPAQPGTAASGASAKCDAHG